MVHSIHQFSLFYIDFFLSFAVIHICSFGYHSCRGGRIENIDDKKKVFSSAPIYSIFHQRAELHSHHEGSGKERIVCAF